MSQTNTVAEDLLRLGGNVDVTETAYTAEQYKNLARLADGNGGHLTVSASKMPAETLKDLVRIAKAHVTIVF